MIRENRINTYGDYKKMLEALNAYSDAGYRDFHSGLVPGEENIHGIRMPVIKSFAKEWAGSYEGIKKFYTDSFYEETVLFGLITAQRKCPDNEYWQGVLSFIPHIKNWAVCDSFAAAMKAVADNRSYYFDRILSLYDTADDFQKRFVIVALMDYYIFPDYLPQIMPCFYKADGGYYVKMAACWALSACLIKYWDMSFDSFRKYAMDPESDRFIVNKTISKCSDSYRMEQQRKRILKELRIK